MIIYRREYQSWSWPASWVHHFGANIPGAKLAHFVEVRTGDSEYLTEQQVGECLRKLADCIDRASGCLEEVSSHFSMTPLFPLPPQEQL